MGQRETTVRRSDTWSSRDDIHCSFRLPVSKRAVPLWPDIGADNDFFCTSTRSTADGALGIVVLLSIKEETVEF
jgi:hypothetical protein